MNETGKLKIYDLEGRTFKFAKEVIAFIGTLPKTIPNAEIGKQVMRSAGSVGANILRRMRLSGEKIF